MTKLLLSPRNMSGNIAMQAECERVETELKSLIIDALKLEDLTPTEIDVEAPLVGDGLGLDSIDILELAMAVHRHFGVKTEADDAENQKIYTSVRSLALYIVSKQQAGQSVETSPAV